MLDLLRRLYSPDAAPGGTTATVEPVAAEPVDDHAAEMDKVTAAAAEFFEQQNNEPPTDSRPRDAHGRFIGKAKDDVQAAVEPLPLASAPEPEPQKPTLDPIWVDTAKEYGVPESELTGLTSGDDVLAKIESYRTSQVDSALKSLGISAAEYEVLRRARAGEFAPPQPQPEQPQKPPVKTATVVSELDELPGFDESALDEETAKTIKGLHEYVSKLKASFVEKTQKLEGELSEFKKQQQQSAEAAERSQRTAQWVELLDKAAAEMPEFQAHFGVKPSELARLAQANPKHAKVRDWRYFGEELTEQFDRFSRILMRHEGDTAGAERALKMAWRDAWKSSHLSKLNGSANGAHGSNGTGYGNGSAVRPDSRRTTPGDVRMPEDNDHDSEIERIRSAIDKVWNGSNPFSNLPLA